MSEPITIVPKIVRWGRRRGAENVKFGKFLGGKRGGKGSSSNSRSKVPSIAALLVIQAHAYGYYNGKRLARKK